MKSFWTLLLSVVFSSVSSMAQGVELYGGYPVSLKARSESQKVSNWNNGVAGINVTAYIRSVAVQVGVGYMSKIIRCTMIGTVEMCFITISMFR